MKILNNKLYIIIFIFSLIFYKGASSDEIARECFDKGYKLDIHGKYKESIKYYNKAIEFNPDYYEVYYNNAKNFLYLGLYDSTIIYINKYNKIDSEYYLAWYIKGYANIYLNKYGEALKCIDKTIYFINIYYDFFILNYYLSSLLGKTGFVKYFYNNIILINKYNNDVLINKGAILSKLGRYEDALKCFSNVLQNNHEYYLAYYNKACVFSIIRNKTEMINMLYIAIMFDNKYKIMADTSNEFKYYKNDPDFKELVK